MNASKAYILTIAGLDPSSGAGLTSDIKTFEAFGLYGLSVCTAVTVQNDINFKSTQWIKTDTIINQLCILFERFNINTVKIGLIENWKVLSLIVEKLKSFNSDIKIVLDPILKASTGFNFHRQDDLAVFGNVLKHIYVITPNYNEIRDLYPDKNTQDTIEYLSSKTNVYLKGGHRTSKKGWDQLFHSKGIQYNLAPIADKVFEKHGSGCVLSSALAASIQYGYTLEEAAYRAKKYTEAFLNSNETLLGQHRYTMLNQNESVK